MRKYLILLSMTSTVIEGHFYVYFNLNLRSYGQLFVLVLLFFYTIKILFLALVIKILKKDYTFLGKIN